MYSNKGYTLVEIIVVSSLLVIVFSIVLAWHLNTSSSDTEDSAEQDYYNTLALLELRLKKDIRSAFTIMKNTENHYSIEIPSLNNKGFWTMEHVEYRLVDQGRKVVRTSNKGDNEYDFSRFLQNRKFVLKINK